MSFSQKEVSLRMISNPCIEVQTTSENRFSVPAWFAEVVIIARYLEKKGRISAFAHQVCLVRGRFGTYEPIDFLALLIGYAISGERTLADFFERVEPFRDSIHGAVWTQWSSSSVQPESLSGRCGSSVFRSLPYALRAAELCRWVDHGNHWRYLRPPGSALHGL